MSDAYVRPDVRAFLDQLAANKAPPLGSVPIEQSRAMFRATRPLIEAEAMPVRHVVDMQYEGPAGPLAMRCYDDRDERGDGTAIVFIHGGGFTLSDIDEYDSVAREYARLTLLPVFSIDYRLAPEHPFPAAPDDCEAAIRFIASDSITLPFEITDLVLSGDSAGGNLAIVTTLALLHKPARVPVIALAPIYPAVTGCRAARPVAPGSVRGATWPPRAATRGGRRDPARGRGASRRDRTGGSFPPVRSPRGRAPGARR